MQSINIENTVSSLNFIIAEITITVFGFEKQFRTLRNNLMIMKIETTKLWYNCKRNAYNLQIQCFETGIQKQYPNWNVMLGAFADSTDFWSETEPIFCMVPNKIWTRVSNGRPSPRPPPRALADLARAHLLQPRASVGAAAASSRQFQSAMCIMKQAWHV